MKRVAAALCLLGAFGIARADSLVTFSRGIGVDPVAGIAAGAPVPNTVLGVPPGGRPWTIRKLQASVETDGAINARGSGLVFSATDAIGTPGAITQVFLTLFCGGAQHSSPAVPLDARGNFSLKGVLTPLPPTPCVAPVLLVRNAGGSLPWFAAGIPGDDD